MTETPEILTKAAEDIDEAMREHASSHASSNSPNSFYCGPQCVSQQLQIVVARVMTPLLEEVDRNARAYGWEAHKTGVLTEQGETSEGNPFIDPEWRSKTEPVPTL